MQLPGVLFSVSLFAAATPMAPGAGPAGFGGQGQVAISSDFEISFTRLADADVSTLKLAPAADYFFAPNLSFGGQAQIIYVSAPGGTTTDLGVGPRIGYLVPLTEAFSIFLRGGLSLRHVSFGPQMGAGTDYNLLSIFGYVPFLFHPVPHFFIGIGPSLFANVAGGNAAQRDVELGIQSTVGGWFDW
jgi:hypothetical protein